MGGVARADRAFAPTPPYLFDRRFLLYGFDVAALLVAPFVATALFHVTGRPLSWLDIATALVTWTIVAWALDCYNVRRAARPTNSIAGALMTLLGTAVVLWVAHALGPGSFVLAGLSPSWLPAAALSLALGRLAYAGVLMRAAFQRPVLVIGPESVGRRLVELVRAEAPREYRVVGWASPQLTAERPGVGRLGGYEDVARIVDTHHVAEVIVTDDDDVDLGRDLVALYEQGVDIRHVSELYEELAGRIPVTSLGSQWFVALRARRIGGRIYDGARRLIDVLVASALLIVTAPILAAAWLAIRIDSAGPAIFQQERTGYRGHVFTMYKFRTMLVDAEGDGPVWATPGDPRRTRLGRLLRPTRLDELPQLWNVLKGDMSLIGPRPERPTFVDRLEAEIPFYRARLLVRPGLSGWAQVRASYASSVQDTVEKLEYDLYYVKHRSPYLDIVIALRTFAVLVRASGR